MFHSSPLNNSVQHCPPSLEILGIIRHLIRSDTFRGLAHLFAANAFRRRPLEIYPQTNDSNDTESCLCRTKPQHSIVKESTEGVQSRPNAPHSETHRIPKRTTPAKRASGSDRSPRSSKTTHSDRSFSNSALAYGIPFPWPAHLCGWTFSLGTFSYSRRDFLLTTQLFENILNDLFDLVVRHGLRLAASANRLIRKSLFT